MIGIIILCLVLFLILLLLFLPIRVFLSYDETLSWKVKFALIPLRDSAKTKETELPEHEPKKPKKEKSKKENLFRRVIRKKGMKEGLQVIFAFLVKVLKKAKRLLKHITFHKICFHLTVGAEDAAQTALLYGEVCTALYPAFSFLDQASNVKYKEISISPDFVRPQVNPQFSCVVTTRIFFLLAAAIGIGIAFLSFRKQVKKDE